MYSHFSGELWGVAAHPLLADIVATVGDDGTLRIWSLKQNKMLKCVKLGWPARCVAWHPLGTMLAIGFHESVKGGFNQAGNTSTGGKKGAKTASGAAPQRDSAVELVRLYKLQLPSSLSAAAPVAQSPARKISRLFTAMTLEKLEALVRHGWGHLVDTVLFSADAGVLLALLPDCSCDDCCAQTC